MDTRNHQLNTGILSVPLSTILCIVLRGTASGQYSSLDTSVDPRTTAMGESFIAVPAYHGAMTYNPAGLAGIKGVSLSYGQINKNEGGVHGSRYLSFKGAIHTPIVDIGLLYTRHNYGEFLFTTEQYPDGPGEVFNPYDYTVGIGIAKGIGDFSIGMAAKRYDRSGVYAPSTIYRRTTTKPLLLDVGTVYTHSFSSNDDAPNQYVSVGLCFQNAGEDIKTETVDIFSMQTLSRFTTTIDLPQYLRIGLAYRFQTRAEIDDRLMPFHFMVTFEYRNRTNANQSAGRDYWGLGVEGTVYEIVSLRLGQYGYREESFVRLGAGLCAPLKKLGVDLPISVRFEYAAMVNDPSTDGDHLFLLGLQYNQEVF